MLSKKVKSRIFFLFFTMVLAVVGMFIVFKSLENNVVYFFSPTEIYSKTNISFGKKIRVGGLVKMNSINKNGLHSGLARRQKKRGQRRHRQQR